MRELTNAELDFVAGAGGECSSSSSGNSYGGVTETSSLGQDLIQIYEGLISATSYMFERVAKSFQ